MSTFTGSELEFLASLRAGWDLLYRNELVRLLKEESERRCRPDNDGAWSAATGSSHRKSQG